MTDDQFLPADDNRAGWVIVYVVLSVVSLLLVVFAIGHLF